MATPTSVAFHTLGCKLNFSETSGIRQMFEKEGYHTVAFEEPADIFVLNTCSVTDFADKKCRYAVRQALKRSPDAKVVVVGCYAQLKPKEISEIEGVDLVLGAAEKFNILNYIEELTQHSGRGMVKAGEIKEVNTFISSYSMGDRTRTFLKVQDGCDYKCTFCTIPLARGKSRSDTIESVLQNITDIKEKGTREIVLTGVNLGDFGNGTEVIEGTRTKKEAMFIDLVQEIEKHDGVDRYRISSIEPNLCTDEVIEFVSQSEKFAHHFHMPLQSGSNKILGMMKRRYRRELYASRVAKVKSLMPDACIGVDVIVGFPGETQEDFLETYHFLKELDIDYLHVFTYSERPNTPAAELGGKVPMNIRRERNEMLRILSEKKKRAFYNRQVGTTRTVIFEDGNVGFTENYVKVFQEGAIPNSIMKVKLERLNVEGLMEARSSVLSL
ncbi:tRNA (N(6)-L-threonylcarbamoyladenosine(37)-C(2))-methylthiotransferase MtaB [Portibacter lacus]|uniref:Threonylcarbamoyladenosine tRNA methylthiotransferase MtaB n=1 Tax=Portibacter lacus TaxID=1099794 RepID=A0AA37WFQ7_9BACT|nr:tRNA (N(6)-L-threonylcarbamoyladenosine(37)-C(2))-methylthiotransferase MtaB [Portibacter lacus]GLR17115.1 tRNA (N(6)-L-threonylcarbamoyladenosine(37)-C(2))-methylthiotransferase MtaB [Portibacter lacus]